MSEQENRPVLDIAWRFPLLRTVGASSTYGSETIVPGPKRRWVVSHGTVYEDRWSTDTIDEHVDFARAKLEIAIGSGVPNEFTGLAQWFPRELQRTTIHKVDLEPCALGVRVDASATTSIEVFTEAALRHGCGTNLVLRASSEYLDGIGDGTHATCSGTVEILTAPTLPIGMVLSLNRHWLSLLCLSSRVDGLSVDRESGHVAAYGNLLVAFPERCLLSWVEAP